MALKLVPCDKNFVFYCNILGIRALISSKLLTLGPIVFMKASTERVLVDDAFARS